MDCKLFKFFIKDYRRKKKEVRVEELSYDKLRGGREEEVRGCEKDVFYFGEILD